MITEGPRINLTLLDAFVKESDSHVVESCSMRQTNRRENYVHARGDLAEGGTGNVFKFMAAFKTPSASGRGLQRARSAAEGKGTFEGGEELEEGTRGG